MANSRIRLVVGGVPHTFDMQRNGRVIVDAAGARPSSEEVSLDFEVAASES